MSLYCNTSLSKTGLTLCQNLFLSSCISVLEGSLKTLVAIRHIRKWERTLAVSLIWQKHFPQGWQEAWRVSSRPIRADFLFSVTYLDLEETTTAIVGPAQPASLIREGSLREERDRIKIRKLTDYTCCYKALRSIFPSLTLLIPGKTKCSTNCSFNYILLCINMSIVMNKAAQRKNYLIGEVDNMEEYRDIDH